jgi:hypothetical protein
MSVKDRKYRRVHELDREVYEESHYHYMQVGEGQWPLCSEIVFGMVRWWKSPAPLRL